MAETFKVGDTVQLKSGGPIMTVTQVAQDSLGVTRVWCVWFDEKGNEKTSTFPIDTVQERMRG